MKILYINLDKDLKRRKHMEEQLSGCGFEYERVSAVNGRTLTQEELDGVYDSQASIKANRKDLTRGELGCALSHKKCHQIALEHDYTLILEDDIELPKNFKEILGQQIDKNTSKKKWDYLQFDYPETGFIFIKRWLVSALLYKKNYLRNSNVIQISNHYIYSCIKFFFILPLSIFEGCRDWVHRIFKINKPVLFIRPLYFAGCYIVSREAALKLVNLENKIVFAADRIQNQARVRGMNVRAFCPLIVKQDRRGLGSSILGVEGINY